MFAHTAGLSAESGPTLVAGGIVPGGYIGQHHAPLAFILARLAVPPLREVDRPAVTPRVLAILLFDWFY